MKSKVCVLCDLCNTIVKEGVCECETVAFKDSTVFCDHNSFTIIKAWFNSSDSIVKYDKVVTTVWDD